VRYWKPVVCKNTVLQVMQFVPQGRAAYADCSKAFFGLEQKRLEYGYKMIYLPT
jgi:hypothetical protein